MSNKCKDSRCLFNSKEKSLDPKFEVVTRNTREGDGLWEKCKHCNLVINRTGVTEEEVNQFYNSDYVKSNSYLSGEEISAKLHFDERIDTLRPIKEIIKPYLNKNMRVMELGSATGELLYLIKDDVKYCFGNEINKYYTEFMKKELNIDGSSNDYFQLSFPEKFDFILSINTIDHMYETGRAIEKIYEDLNSEGWLYIEVPNDEQALKRYLPEETRLKFQTFMYQKAHYYSFTFQTLSDLLIQKGFEIVKKLSRHDYTLINYLQWYYLGKPQKRLNDAMRNTDLHSGNSKFEVDLNELFFRMDLNFKEIITNNFAGELIGILAKKTKDTI